MAVVKRVRRLANPYKKRRANARATTIKRKPTRKLSLKQKLHFGTSRQRAAAKLALHRKRKAPKRNPTSKRRVTRRKVTRRNPALVVTLGALNPRRKKMAKRRKSVRRRKAVANPRRRVARRRPAVRRRRRAVANPTPRRRRRVSRRRRAVANPRRKSYSRRRRNPISVFGSTGSSAMLSMIGGGLVGVAAAKLIPRTLASTMSGITGGMGQYGGLVLTGVSAWAAGWAATKFVNPTFGNAVLFGGLMQLGSVALNLFLPSFSVGGVPLALSGMGEFVPGSFAVPQNPLRLPAAPAPAARVEMNGLNRAYGRAF